VPVDLFRKLDDPRELVRDVIESRLNRLPAPSLEINDMIQVVLLKIGDKRAHLFRVQIGAPLSMAMAVIMVVPVIFIH